MTSAVDAIPHPASLKQRTASGARWSAVSHFAKQGIGFLCTAILARLLAPSEYGLLGMAVIVTGFAGMFSDLGTSSALIQRQTMSQRMLSSLFWANLVIGLFLTLIVAAISPLAAVFFREPRVALLLCALAPAFIVSSLSVIQKSTWQRDLLFRALSQTEIAAAATGGAVAVAAALAGWGVWSLVWQLYAASLAQGILLWSLVRWKPRWVFAWEDFRSVRRYSLHLVAFNAVNYWARTADNTLIGRYLGPASLGFYSMAYRLMQYPAIAVSGLLGRVLFPAFSRIQHDDEAFRRAYLKTVGLISLITFPMMLGLLALARPLVHVLLSAKWDPIVTPVMILALVGANQSVATTTGNIYTAKGRTDLMFWVGMFNSAIYVTGIIVGLRWGIIGVAACYGIADLIVTPIDFFFAFRLIKLRFRSVWAQTSRPLLSSVLMAALVYLTSPVVFGALNKAPALALLVAMGAGLYVAINWTTNRPQLTELFAIALRS